MNTYFQGKTWLVQLLVEREDDNLHNAYVVYFVFKFLHTLNLLHFFDF
jgi:hypothetical protein